LAEFVRLADQAAVASRWESSSNDGFDATLAGTPATATASGDRQRQPLKLRGKKEFRFMDIGLFVLEPGRGDDITFSDDRSPPE